MEMCKILEKLKNVLIYNLENYFYIIIRNLWVYDIKQFSYFKKKKKILIQKQIFLKKFHIASKILINNHVLIKNSYF